MNYDYSISVDDLNLNIPVINEVEYNKFMKKIQSQRNNQNKIVKIRKVNPIEEIDDSDLMTGTSEPIKLTFEQEEATRKLQAEREVENRRNIQDVADNFLDVENINQHQQEKIADFREIDKFITESQIHDSKNSIQNFMDYRLALQLIIKYSNSSKRAKMIAEFLFTRFPQGALSNNLEDFNKSMVDIQNTLPRFRISDNIEPDLTAGDIRKLQTLEVLLGRSSVPLYPEKHAAKAIEVFLKFISEKNIFYNPVGLSKDEDLTNLLTKYRLGIHITDNQIFAVPTQGTGNATLLSEFFSKRKIGMTKTSETNQPSLDKKLKTKGKTNRRNINDDQSYNEEEDIVLSKYSR